MYLQNSLSNKIKLSITYICIERIERKHLVQPVETAMQIYKNAQHTTMKFD